MFNLDVVYNQRRMSAAIARGQLVSISPKSQVALALRQEVRVHEMIADCALAARTGQLTWTTQEPGA